MVQTVPFAKGGAGSGLRVRSRAGFPGNRVFPGLRHGFPFTRLTLVLVIVGDATTDRFIHSQQVTDDLDQLG